MTQHRSLRSSEKSKQHRSVLKRFERLKYHKEKGEWEEERSIFGLPKIKLLKFKIKKEKAAPAEEAAAAAGAPGQAEGAGAKEAAQTAAAKGEAKGQQEARGPAKETTKKEEKGKK